MLLCDVRAAVGASHRIRNTSEPRVRISIYISIYIYIYIYVCMYIDIPKDR